MLTYQQEYVLRRLRKVAATFDRGATEEAMDRARRFECPADVIKAAVLDARREVIAAEIAAI